MKRSKRQMFNIKFKYYGVLKQNYAARRAAKNFEVLRDIFELKTCFFLQKAARRAAKMFGYFGRQILGAESGKSGKRQFFGLEKKNYKFYARHHSKCSIHPNTVRVIPVSIDHFYGSTGSTWKYKKEGGGEEVFKI